MAQVKEQEQPVCIEAWGVAYRLKPGGAVRLIVKDWWKAGYARAEAKALANSMHDVRVVRVQIREHPAPSAS